MSSNLYNADHMREMFVQYLNKQNFRKTPERFTILEHICHIHGHFDVETLHKQLDEEKFHVSRASIYNTLELLMNAGLIVRHQFSSQLVQYELRAVAVTHYHVICNYCGMVREVKNDRMTRELISRRIPKFTCEYHSLNIYGICSKCKFRLTNEKNRKQTKCNS
jgi:Fur family ferric uptake transcriptional regulator